MKYIKNFEDIHLGMLSSLAETLTNEHGLSLRDFHYRLREKTIFEHWLKSVLFKDVWDYPMYIEMKDLAVSARRRKENAFRSMKEHLTSMEVSNTHPKTLNHIKRAYLEILKEVEGHRFDVRMFEENMNTPTLWLKKGKTRVGKEDYYVSFGDMMHFFTILAFSDQEKHEYQAILDIYFTISFDFATHHDVHLNPELTGIIPSPSENLIELGKEIFHYIIHTNQRLN